MNLKFSTSQVDVFSTPTGNVVTRFECPSSTALFIATVARQIPQTKYWYTDCQPVIGSRERHLSQQLLTPEISSRLFYRWHSYLLMVRQQVQLLHRESVSGIAAKVRGLSSFAMNRVLVFLKPSIRPLSKNEIAQEKTFGHAFPMRLNRQ